MGLGCHNACFCSLRGPWGLLQFYAVLLLLVSYLLVCVLLFFGVAFSLVICFNALLFGCAVGGCSALLGGWLCLECSMSVVVAIVSVIVPLVIVWELCASLLFLFVCFFLLSQPCLGASSIVR